MPRRRRRKGPAHPWQKRRRRALALLVVAGLLLAIPIWLRTKGHAAYEAALSTYLPEGFPHTLAAAQAWYDTRRADNAAGARYLTLVGNVAPASPEDWEDVPYLNQQTPTRGETWTPEERVAIDGTLKAFSETIDELVMLADGGEAWPPVTFSENVVFGSPLPESRRAINLLRLATHRAAVAGDVERTLDGVRAIVQTARAFRTAPLLQPALRYLHDYRQAVEMFSVTTAHVRYDATQRSKLTALFASEDDVRYLGPMVDMQRMLLAVEYGPAITRHHSPPMASVEEVTGMLERRAGAALAATQVIHDLLGMPPEQALREYGDAMEAMRERLYGLGLDSPVYRLFPMLGEKIAFQRMAAVGVALLTFEAEQGRFPETLDALAAVAAHDPYTEGAPFRYRVAESGRVAVLYSVGEDGVDNGGVRATPVAPGDLVVQFGPVPASDR